MPILTVKLKDGERRIPFNTGRSLRDILDLTDLRVRSGCRGRGACGLCRVRIEAGNLGAPTTNERINLDTSELARGIRLACQVMPNQDLRMVLLAQAPKSNWRSLFDDPGRHVLRFPLLALEDLPGKVATPYGVAVDLGTTHISLSLYELTGGTRLAGRYGLNPQMLYGSDVMTRLVAACDSPDCAGDMSRQVVDAISEALFDIAAREGIDIAQVVRLALVGNTAMLALLSGRNYALLLKPRHWMDPIDCLPDPSDALPVSLGIHPLARIEILPPLAGFVGSDLLAGVVTTNLTESEDCGLFIDFGTNSEIALWDGRDLWVTSAAGGPAFEESGIGCGMSAEAGAIYRVGFREDAFDYSVIADSEPRGICGSGLVDLIAGLVRSGRMSVMGRFLPPVPRESFVLARGERDIVLTKGDVDVFQRAKAAIGTGIQVLLDRAAIGCKDVKRICIGGFFGSFLNVTHAQEIGLLPRIQPELVELWGNTALAGCADALLSPVAVERMHSLGEQARPINLSRCPDFDELFMKNLYLLPMGGE